MVELRVGEEVDHHGGDRRPVGDARAGDLHAGAVAIPAREDHHGRAEVDRRVHAGLHAGDMEHRQRREVLLLTKSRLLDQRKAARSDAHRNMLEQALEAIDEELNSL